jgi:hypothetical protein
MGFIKDKFKKRRETHENGYVSFTQDDLKEKMKANPANEKAYEFLDAAMCTSSHITIEDENQQTVNIDDVYPCSEAECDEMDRLLDRAQAEVKDKNDQFFKERYEELREIVKWSRKKHWTFKWSLIAGCILSIFIMFYISEQVASDRQAIEAKVEGIKNWQKQDTTIAFADCRTDSLVYSLANANAHKAYRLGHLKKSHEKALESVEEYKNRLDTTQNRELKKAYKERIKAYEDDAKAYLKEYEEVNDMKFKKYRKAVVKSYKDDLRAARWLDRIVWLICIYVLLLTPFYIYSSHQYGYYITRYRAESARLDKLQKIGFAFASFLLGASLALEFFPETKVTTVYSSGRRETHTESNPLDIAIMILKLCLLAAAACVFSFVSIYIMSHVTIAAFKRNHDWSKMAAATAALATAATKVAGKAGEVAKQAATKAIDAANEKINQQKQLENGNTEDTEM